MIAVLADPVMIAVLADVSARLEAVRAGLLEELRAAYVGAAVSWVDADQPTRRGGLVVDATWVGDAAALVVEADGALYTVTDVRGEP